MKREKQSEKKERGKDSDPGFEGEKNPQGQNSPFTEGERRRITQRGKTAGEKRKDKGEKTKMKESSGSREKRRKKAEKN